jgi:penicillin-binding protein 2
MRVCGKTGTSQKKNARGELETWITWFLSFAPYEKPRYAVVVMIEGGSSGGGTCAPVGREIYDGIVKRERTNTTPTGAVAQSH